MTLICKAVLYYKQFGNSVAIPVIENIAKLIHRELYNVNK